MKKLKKTFTLVELLVVVTILAILAGGAIAVFDGVERRAAKGQAINEIAALTAAITNSIYLSGRYPTNFDSLLQSSLNEDPPIAANLSFGNGLESDDKRQALYNVSSWQDMVNKNLVDFGAVATDVDTNGGNQSGTFGMVNASIVPFVSAELRDKISLIQFSTASRVLDTLCASGIISLRYIENGSIHIDAGGRHNAYNIGPPYTNGVSKYERHLDIIDGSQAFEAPQFEEIPNNPGNLVKNLGRGGTVFIAKGDKDRSDGIDFEIDLVVWNPGVLGANNLIIGGNGNDVLVALGIGVNSLRTTKTADEDVNSTDVVTGLSVVPKYAGDSDNHIYGRFIALFKVGEVVDVNGAPDLSQFVEKDGTLIHSGESDPKDATSVAGFYSIFVAGSTAGYRRLNSAVFVAVVDCFGNTKTELQRQFNN